jgi:hypothetical protein
MESKIFAENAKPRSQMQANHRITTFPFIKTRYFKGYTTIKKRSSDIEAIVTMDTSIPDLIVNCKAIQYHFFAQHVNGVLRQAKKSETAKVTMRYVAGFQKHFNGSFINATITNTCEIAPNIQIT